MTAPADPSILVLDGSTTAERDVLGGKAWSIQRMRTLGIPVPPAFVLTTEICRRYHAADRTLPAGIWDGIPAAMAELESATGRRFGVARRPRLVSVRSGAATSMPGMMDTVLDLGMTDEVEKALAAESGDPAYAADTPLQVDSIDELTESTEAVASTCATPQHDTTSADRSRSGIRHSPNSFDESA